jgi:hypothetical protein
LDILQKILNVEQYPFYMQIKESIGDEKRFSSFINEFFKDYDKNYILCKNWVNECHLKLMNKLNTENSFLDIIKNGLHNNLNKTTKKIF